MFDNGHFGTTEMTVSPPRTLDAIAPGVAAPAGERTAPDGFTIPLSAHLDFFLPAPTQGSSPRWLSIPIRNSGAGPANYALAMDNSVTFSARQALPSPAGPAWQGEESSRFAGPVCFGRHRQPATHAGAGLRLRLQTVHADALARLLPVLLCGEESAALAMERIGSSVGGEREMRDALARIARDELEHQALLQRVRAVLPEPLVRGWQRPCDW